MTLVKTKKPFKIGSKVQWNWMGFAVKGSIIKVHFKTIEKTLRGTTYRRNGTYEVPAYSIMSDRGSEVLKSHTELIAAKR